MRKEWVVFHPGIKVHGTNFYWFLKPLTICTTFLGVAPFVEGKVEESTQETAGDLYSRKNKT